MKGKQRKKIALSFGALALITAIITTVSLLISTKNDKEKYLSDPEIQRSMEYEQVQEGDEKVPNTDYVQFDAFFLRDLDGDGYAEQVRGTCREIDKTDTLYINLNVLTNGKLENGKITINGSNMNFSTALVEDNVIKQNYISDNTTEIDLKDVNNGTQKLMYGIVKASDFGNDTNKYSAVNSITLTGTHVADDGTRTEISKTVNFNVDWYGTVTANIYTYTGTQNIEGITDENKENIALKFSVSTSETEDELILKKAVLEGTIPALNGYKPTSVEMTSSNVNFEYDEETGNFTATKEASINEAGIVTSNAYSGYRNSYERYNTFSFTVTYPYEAYESLTDDTLSIQVPVKAYYEGYNNPNDEFENPIQSNIVERTITFLWRKPEGSVARFDVTVGTYRGYDGNYVISKEEPLKIYNGTAEETEDLYTVRWYAYTGNTVKIDSIQMQDNSNPNSDRFQNTDQAYFNMVDYTSNVGIYFSSAENTLGEDGYIKVINADTGAEIHTFTKEDWNNYSSSSPYMYDEPVKHIRIETSKANQNASFYVYNVKEIDDNVLTTTFTKPEFDKLERVYTYLTGNIKTEGSQEYTKINDDIASAIYEEPISVANITVNRDTIGTQNTEDGIDLTISTRSDYYNMKGWENGRFLIELPEEILDVQINSVNISNSSVRILAYEIVEKDGKKFIKVETENDGEANYNITVNVNLTADPRSVTTNKDVKLYAYNEYCDNYKNKTADIYDVDGDENVTENVNYSSDVLHIVSPSSLLTNQQATNYNEAGETAVAPQIATIDKTEADTATVNVSVTNNYSGTISEVTILGKIPFQGNKFSINGTDLGSTYTTQMLDGGITVPTELQGKVTVYYSEKEDPTNDLTNPENGWTTTPDFSKVKTYLIDLGDYVLSIGESKVFTYQIKVPSTVQYNDVSYSAHAVYFCLDTEAGKYKTQTETTKLGFRIERKYHLSLTKVKENTAVPVQGATFSVTADGETESRTGTTNNSGTFTIENLLVDKTYTLKEIRTPGSYETNNMEVKFKVVVQDNQLVIQFLSGQDSIKGYNITQATTDERGILNLKVENTPKYKVIITKKDNKDGSLLAGVKYKLEGEGLGNGITVTTNKEGILTLTGLSHDVEYTLTEQEAKDYYVNETPVKFKVVNNAGTLQFVVTSGSFNSNSQVTTGTGVTGLDAQDTVTAELTDEKIPTYKITVKKLAKEEDTTLRGAQYKITGEGIDEKGATYTTDESGVLTIPNLYEYVEGKNITGVYTLEEITPPEGYALDSRQLQFRAKRVDGKLQLEVLNDNFLRNSSVTDADNANAVINLEFEDEPLFKITKIDGNTKLPIQNAKFVIKEIDENYDELGYAKDINGNVVGTEEDGIPVVETDENGEISYGLKTGLYKATEIEAPEGYEFPENEADRTYYFGIGESKAQETTFGTSFRDAVAGDFWNKTESVKATMDNGFVTSGFFTKAADLNNDGNADVTGNDLYYSGFIAKYNNAGNLEFANSVYSTDGTVQLHKVIQTNYGDYIVVGSFTGTDLQVGEVSTGLTNTTNNKKAVVIKIGSSGNYEWAKEIALEGSDYDATAVTQNLAGNIVVGVTTGANPIVIEYSYVDGNEIGRATISSNVKISDMDGYNSQDVIIVSQGLTDTTTGRVDYYSNSSVNAGMTLDFNANAVARLDNGKAIIVGSYTGTAQTVATKGNYDGIIAVYDVNSNAIESTKFIRGTLDEVMTSVAKAEDGGYIVGGYTYSSQVDFNQEETTYEIPSISGYSDGFIIKYDTNGDQAWYKQISGDGLDEVTGVTERDSNEFVAVGYFNSTTLKGDVSDSEVLSLSKYTDGFVLNYGEIVTAPEVPESSEITVENNLKKFKITTDVEEVDGVKGGSISGEDEQPYETVEYGKDSTKEIKIVPDSGYKIVKITINGENYEFTPAEDGTVTMPQFTNMQTDKHVVVTFSNTASSVLVHHYVDGTKDPVAPDDHIAGTIGEPYTTVPHMDLEKYELKKVDGEYDIPDNASGTFTEQEQVVTYYYVKKQVPLTVHHYIEGTTDGVPLASGGSAQDEVSTGEIGTDYTTDALTPEELNPKYELSITPDNATGKYVDGGVTVTYYYKAKEVNITTEVKTHKETNEYGEEVDVKGGSISGENEDPYETVIYGEDSQKDIIATPDENYQVKEILVNGEPVEFTPESDGTVKLNKFTDMTEDKNVVVEFEKIPAQVIVHYYIENTTDRVPLAGGGEAQDITQTGVVGDIYASKPADNVDPAYELIATPENASGNMTKDTIVVTYYYRLKDTSVLVHHYIMNSDGTTTETKVPNKNGGVVEDETIPGRVNDAYNTNPSSEIADNYEVVTEKLPANANGNMTIEQIVVTYYYKLKDPSIEQSKIDKESSLDKVTAKDQAIPYTITYTANVTDYIGDAEVVIVDTLPYAIDEGKSDLNGGTYNSGNHTITWTENITGINSFTNTNNQINITKNISVVYADLDVTQAKVTNTVTGTINLKTPEKTDTVEDTEEIPTEFLVNVPVAKVWDDNNNSAGKRPTEVTMVLTSSDVNDENSPYKITLNSTNADSQDSNNKWTYTFANLPKYDTNGNENVYTLSEELENIYYTAENRNVEQATKTITNTFKVPTDTINVPVVKVWADNGDVAGKRPESIDLVLTGNDGKQYRHTLTVENVDSTDSNKWLYTFNDLPKYNSVNGDEIVYTLSEENVNSNFYVASVDQGSKTVTNTFDVPDETISVPAKKYWDDNSNANGRRPTSIMLTLTGKGQGVNISKEQEVTVGNAVDGDTNTWGYTFTELPKYDEYGDEVVYTINEKDTGNEFYIKSNVDQETRTVTNKFQVPGENINVTVTKVWNDNNNSAGKRAESVTLQVKNGEEVVATEPVTESEGWSHTFSVPKYNLNGQEINYTADEADLGSIYYTTANKSISGDMASGYTITNTFAVPDEKISVPVTKVWDDNGNAAGKRPDSVTLVLTSDDTTDTNSPYKVTLNSTNADQQNNNQWKYTFENLPKYNSVNGDEIVYTLSEELDNIYYTSVNSKVDQLSKTITNKFAVPDDTIDVPVVKVWSDNGNAAGKRPDSVTLVLTGNDTNDRNNPYKYTLTAENVDTSDANRWLYTFNDLPKYNSVNGDEITYTLSEENMNNKFYTASVDQGSKTVTNTFGVPKETTSVTVTKIWNDKNNLAGKRPGSVTITLTGTGEGVNSHYEQDLTAENADQSNMNNWLYTFNDLPKLDNYGNEIQYTVDEVDLGNKFYTKGTVDQSAKTITNISKYGKVIVHHYIMNTDGTKTENKVPSNTGEEVKDQTIEGAQGEEYTTSSADNIAPNYELVQDELPTNATGYITENDTEVIYYYRLKTPSVTNTVTKSGTDRITSANQEVNYTITYTANVTDYIGNAEVTIVDTLPYAIDEEKSALNGGTYNAGDHTITWTEQVSDLNSYNGKGSVNIIKNIKVVYVGLDMSQEKIINNVTGHIKLLTPEKTSEETTDNFESTIYKSIISAEKMVDKTEANEGDKITYTVRITNDGNLAKTVTLADTLPEGLTFDTNTQIKVGNTGTVYTEQNLKNGIQVEVPEHGTVEVTFAGIVDNLGEGIYSKVLTNKATIDNEPTNEVTTTVTKPNISAHKESDPASGSKVREGDTITYRIRVRNDGTREGTVLVKDTIPTGTTFVEGSIKVGEVAHSEMTADNLREGISVTVGINSEVVVEFKVTVNKQVDGTKIKNTAYINDGEDKKVPEEPEHTYVEPKEEQSITKDGTGKVDSLSQEITYNIHYTATITDYEGNAKVVLVDQLPYALDTNKTNILEDLDGGTYDAEKHTITWEQALNDIQMNETKEVTIDKTIKVVYTGISQDTVSIKNIVTGHIEYETPERTSEEVEANKTTTTGFIINMPVSKVWDDNDNKLGQRPTRVVFKLSGSDGSERTLELAKPGTAGTTTTQDEENPNKWNDMFKDLPKYDSSNNEIVYTLTEEEKTEGELKYYESSVDNDSRTVTNTNKYGKVTVHHYIINPDGTTTTNKVPDTNGTEIPDEIIEGKEGTSYETKPAENVNEKYELVSEATVGEPNGTINKYDEANPQEVIYYYRLKPAKVIIHYLEKDEDSDDSNNQVLANNEQIDGHVDDPYNTDTEHKKDTIEKDGKTYTLVSNSGNTEGTMTVADTNVTYYYLQNTKATVKYVEGNPETGEIVRNLEDPYTQEGLVGDEFKTVEKQFTGYRLIQSPNPTTIKMTKEEQTLIYWYEPVYTGLIENHIDDKTNKILYTEEHEVQVGQSYNIPPRTFGGYDRVTDKDPINASGTMGEELVTVNYYYIKKAVLEVNYIDKTTGEPLTEQIVDDTKHEGDQYTTDKKTFEGYDLVEVPENAQGTLEVETDENGNITNNKTVVTYYYVKKSAGVEEHHIDILTGKELEEPTLHEGHVGDEYDIKSKEFLSYVVAETDKEGNNVLPTNAQGTMTEDKIVVNYYYYQPAKVIVHYVDKTTGKELEETNPETGELQSSQVVIEGQNTDPYETTAKEFEYYELVELPKEPNGTMKVEITKDENGNDIVNNTIDVYYYYEPKPFNIGVEKEISGIIVNGERRSATNGKLEKVDIYRKSTENTSVQVEYKIKVMNTGEVEGRARIEDKLPEGMSLANNDGTWEVNNGTLTKVIPEIGAGETKEYTVLLNWNTSGDNMGNKINEVSLIQTDNVPGFKDNNDKDNTDQATTLISVETGELPVGLLIALAGLVALESVTLRYAVVLTKRQKKSNKK